MLLCTKMPETPPLLWLQLVTPTLTSVSLHRYAGNDKYHFLISCYIHLQFLSLCSLHFNPFPHLFSSQDDNTFIVSHFTGEHCYTITEEWIITNSTHLPPSDQIMQSLLSSPNDLLRLLAQVPTISPQFTFPYYVNYLLFRVCQSAVLIVCLGLLGLLD